MHNLVVQVKTDEPNYSSIPDNVYDWEQSVYAGAEEVLPKDAPIPLEIGEIYTPYILHNPVSLIELTFARALCATVCS